MEKDPECHVGPLKKLKSAQTWPVALKRRHKQLQEKPKLSYIDKTGRFHKLSLVLPEIIYQEEPKYYHSSTQEVMRMISRKSLKSALSGISQISRIS